MFKKVVVGISGGVDSAVATLLLKNKGFDVHAVFMQNWDIADETGVCRADEDYSDACMVCEKLNVPIRRINFVKEYWNEVFSCFLKEYETGFTPNPDILCNRFIKFDYFYHYARENLYADAIGTGHYAKTSFGPYLEEYDSNTPVKLLRPKDYTKDQTFFLSQIKQEALQRTMFPLSDYLKWEVRQLAAEHNLYNVANKKESMGICFVGNRNFQDFISEYIENKPGKFINIDNAEVVGEHNGVHQWTIGQRTRIEGRKLPFFVARKDAATNTIYVAEGQKHSALYSDLFFTDKPHWICGKPIELQQNNILACTFIFQNTEEPVDCELYETNRGLVVSLFKPKRALAPGQYAVFYKENECIGSAKIMSSGPSNFLLYWLQMNKVVYVAHRINKHKTIVKKDSEEDESVKETVVQKDVKQPLPADLTNSSYDEAKCYLVNACMFLRPLHTRRWCRPLLTLHF